MRILAIQKSLFIYFILCFASINAIAQDMKITVKQDSKFEQLLNEKRKINISNAVNAPL